MSDSDLIWINGEIVPFAEARLNVEDRGFQFADGVYEVIRLYGGRPFTLAEHLDRLYRSAAGIELSLPLGRDELAREIQKLVARGGVRDGMVYFQATRGIAPRNHAFPAYPKPTLLAYCRPLPPPPRPGEGDGVKLLPVPDERWQRCWVKSIALLPNVLAKNAAVTRGYDEAVFIDAGRVVTECSASNVYAVIGGKLVTHPVGPKVLPGITRAVLFGAASGAGVVVEERPYTEDEVVGGASEVFITSTTREVSWVSRWGDRPIRAGNCGPVTRRLHEALRQRVAAEVGAEASA
jgi:D-alanine transaminase